MKYRHENESAVLDYITTLNNEPTTRGKVWEEKIHNLIRSSGICGTLRDLETDEVIDHFIIQSSSSAHFNQLKEIDSATDYWRPISKRHPTCDAYILSKGLMVQMTVGAEHGINVNGLESVLKSGIFTEWENQHPNELLKLVLIVDGQAYEKFRKDQAYTYNPEARKANNRSARDKKQMDLESRYKQYVMKVDLEEELRGKKSGLERV
jgi:hypothetical protein